LSGHQHDHKLAHEPYNQDRAPSPATWRGRLPPPMPPDNQDRSPSPTTWRDQPPPPPMPDQQDRSPSPTTWRGRLPPPAHDFEQPDGLEQRRLRLAIQRRSPLPISRGNSRTTHAIV
jgi:hypothetical protein